MAEDKLKCLFELMRVSEMPSIEIIQKSEMCAFGKVYLCAIMGMTKVIYDQFKRCAAVHG